MKGNMNSANDDMTECDPPTASQNSSENSEEPPRKISKMPSPPCKAVHDTELHVAVRKNDTSSVQAILLREPSLVDVGDSFGLTALHIAAQSGYKEIVQMLLTAGANSRIQDPSCHVSPLHLALRWNKADAAEVLVDWDAGGMPNDLRDDYGRTPLYWAAHEGYTEIVKKLVATGVDTHLSDPAGRTPLHVAIYYNKEDAANALIDYGAANDLQNKDGRSPLHFAVSEGYVEMCKKLLAAGCSAHLQDHKGASPLHLALQKGEEDVAMVLLDFDGVNNLQDDQGMTPLHWASYMGSLRIVQRLVSSCANHHLRNKQGRTPLHLAVWHTNKQVAEFLIDSGALDEIQCRDQTPLLHVATKMHWTNVVRKLLFCDLHPHIMYNEVYPLENALEHVHKEILRLILSMYSLKDIEINWEEMEVKPDEIQYCIELLSEYGAETRRMKSTMVPGTTVSYHDLAKGHVNTLARYLDNELIQKFLSCENALEDFPNYAEMIAFKMEKAESRKILTDQFLQDFVLLFRKLPSLPPLCINIILRYLTNQDLQNFIEAFKFTPL